ncbi:MAG: hypothetical protein AAGE03_01620 [Pseudomonadota bacterium]
MVAPLELVLDGPVRLLDPSGRDCTPRGAKERGILAILGTTPGMRLARARLQDLLWSDRGQSQGATSLRGALSELRRALGPRRDVLVGGPGWIGLEPDQVQVILPSGPNAGDRFCTDLDITDPEFEDWLRDSRMSDFPQSLPGTSTQLSNPDAPLVLILPDFGQSGHAVADMVLADAAGRVAQFIPTLILGSGAVPTMAGRRLRVQAGVVMGLDNEAIISLRLVDETAGGLQIWSHLDSLALVTGQMAPAVRALSEVLSGAILDTVGLRILSMMHRFDSDSLVQLDTHLATGKSGLLSDVTPAVRAFVRYKMRVERLISQDDLEEASELSREALAAAPRNPLNLAVGALMAVQRGDIAAAVDQVGRARSGDASQALVRFATAAVLAQSGRETEAYAIAESARAGDVSMLGPANTAVAAAAAATAARQEAAALDHARAAKGLAPDCRAALRFVAALAFRAGAEEEAATALARLAQLEPDFAPQRLLDPDYPVANLRRAGFLQVAEAGLI